MRSPRLAQWILTALLPADLRDAVLGDLEEGYRAAASPRLWYWSQVLRSLWGVACLDWRRFGMVRIASAALATVLVTELCLLGLTLLNATWMPGILGPYGGLLRMTVNLLTAAIGGAVIAVLTPRRPIRATLLFAAFLMAFSMSRGAIQPFWACVAAVVAGPLVAIVAGLYARSQRSAAA